MKKKNYKKIDTPSVISIKNIITVYRIEYNSKKHSSPEMHDFPELTFVESGEFSEAVDGIENNLCAGDLIIYPPDSLHAEYTRDCEGIIYIITFDTEEIIKENIFKRVFKLTPKQRMLISEIFTTALQIAKPQRLGVSIEDGQNGLVVQQIKNNLELLLIDLSLSANDNSENKITMSNSSIAAHSDFEKITEFMKMNIKREMTLEDIANGSSMSVSKLKKVFSSNYRGGVISYMNSLKVAEAKRLIARSNMNFSQIAEHLGFTSLHYFSRVFKAKTNMSPTQYAKSIYKQ